jgi:hypothetical protein
LKTFQYRNLPDISPSIVDLLLRNQGESLTQLELACAGNVEYRAALGFKRLSALRLFQGNSSLVKALLWTRLPSLKHLEVGKLEGVEFGTINGMEGLRLRSLVAPLFEFLQLGRILDLSSLRSLTINAEGDTRVPGDDLNLNPIPSVDELSICVTTANALVPAILRCFYRLRRLRVFAAEGKLPHPKILARDHGSTLESLVWGRRRTFPYSEGHHRQPQGIDAAQLLFICERFTRLTELGVYGDRLHKGTRNLRKAYKVRYS